MSFGLGIALGAWCETDPDYEHVVASLGKLWLQRNASAWLARNLPLPLNTHQISHWTLIRFPRTWTCFMDKPMSEHGTCTELHYIMSLSSDSGVPLACAEVKCNQKLSVCSTKVTRVHMHPQESPCWSAGSGWTPLQSAERPSASTRALVGLKSHFCC